MLKVKVILFAIIWCTLTTSCAQSYAIIGPLYEDCTSNGFDIRITATQQTNGIKFEVHPANTEEPDPLQLIHIKSSDPYYHVWEYHFTPQNWSEGHTYLVQVFDQEVAVGLVEVLYTINEPN